MVLLPHPGEKPTSDNIGLFRYNLMKRLIFFLPTCDLGEGLLLSTVFCVPDGLPSLMYHMGLKIRRLRDNLKKKFIGAYLNKFYNLMILSKYLNSTKNDVISDIVSCPFEHLHQCVNVASLPRSRCVSVCSNQHA
jgi:hypothetical protein